MNSSKNQTDVWTHIRTGIGNDEAIMNQVLRSQGIDVNDASDVQQETVEIEGIQWYLA